MWLLSSRFIAETLEKCIVLYYIWRAADTALPSWSTQGRVEKELGMGTGTEKISWQW
jgi:hypothetical protein